MEENNKGFIFISNDKEADTTIKVNYKGFVFFDVYGLENDKIYKIVDDLVYQFDLRAGKEHFFEEEKEYIALINASKCKTYLGFIKALNEAFFIHTGYEENINDTRWHIFSSDVGHRKIKMLFT